MRKRQEDSVLKVWAPLTSLRINFSSQISTSAYSATLSFSKCAESVSRTHIACSSDRCLDHLGYLGSSLPLFQSKLQYYIAYTKRSEVWTMRDLNPRHLQCKWSALPAELIVLTAKSKALRAKRYTLCIMLYALSSVSADERTWTSTPYGTATSRLRVYHFTTSA